MFYNSDDFFSCTYGPAFSGPFQIMLKRKENDRQAKTESGQHCLGFRHMLEKFWNIGFIYLAPFRGPCLLGISGAQASTATRPPRSSCTVTMYVLRVCTLRPAPWLRLSPHQCTERNRGIGATFSKQRLRRSHILRKRENEKGKCLAERPLLWV